MKFKTIAVALAFATLVPAAFAQTYVGVGVGASHINVACDDGFTCTYTDAAAKLLVGYTFPGTDFAVEGVYSHLGTFKESGADGHVDIEGSSWGVGGAWRPQFGSGWGGVLRAGAAYGTARTHYAVVVPGAPTSTINGSETKYTWQPTVGAGLTYALAPNIRLEADWDNTRVTATLQGFKAKDTVNTYTLGATFGF